MREFICYEQVKQNFLAGVKACLPTIFGYLSIGFAAGVIEKAAGMNIFEIVLLSVLVYAGSAQFVIAAMLLASTSLSSIILAVFFINLRHLLLSAALTPYFQKLSPQKNFFIGSLLTDETFGVAIAEGMHKKEISYYWMMGLNITAYLNWIVATIIGGLCGEMIDNFTKYGVDFALPAMFAGLLVLQLLLVKAKMKLYLTVVGVSVISFFLISLILPGMWSIILTAVIGSFFGLLVQKWQLD